MAAAARVFTLAVIAATALAGDLRLDGVAMVAAIACVAQGLSLLPRVPTGTVVVLEGAATALVAASSFPAHEAAMPYLATPALIAGIAAGLRLTLLVLAAEAVALGATWYLDGQSSDLGRSGVTWLATGLGLGLLGSFTRRTINQPGDDSYRSALDLIRQLHALRGQLTSGLDPVDLADQTLATVADELVVRQAVVVIKNSTGDFVPLRFSAGTIPFSLGPADELLRRCWRTGEPILETSRVVLPLSAENEMVAVIVADCITLPDARSVDRALRRLRGDAVRLNAALLFASVRESAVSEERHRIAREVHDGVAQDVASLGYLIDNLATAGSDPEQDEHVQRLRKEVSRVVKELRNSVFDLRNDVASAHGLGQSIASFARHVGSHSDLTVHVTLDESTIRLRQTVEAELLRIAQEAINNARRHSGGQNLWVNCSVNPPYASIEVIDDGDGLGTARSDSHGLQIMRERAARIGAELVLESPVVAERGTRIVVRLDWPTIAPTTD